jgi:hypothetical protein
MKGKTYWTFLEVGNERGGAVGGLKKRRKNNTTAWRLLFSRPERNY